MIRLRSRERFRAVYARTARARFEAERILSAHMHAGDEPEAP